MTRRPYHQTDLKPEQTDGLAAWLDDLPEELASHAQVLRRLLAEAEADPRMRALQVQGSIGRGTADRHSDLDLGMVVTDDAWPVLVDEMAALVHRLGEVVDDYYQFVPSTESPDMFRAWAHFAGGFQLDLMVLPGSRLMGSGPDGRTLIDHDGVLLRTDHPMRVAQPSDIAKWAFLCWQNLAETLKYLERDRPVAAAEWLNSARQATISCWAAAHGVEYAGYANVAAARLGISCPWPVGLEKTYATLEPDAVAASAVALAQLQAQTDLLLSHRLGIPSRPFASWVMERLEALAVAPPRSGSRLGPRSRRETAREGGRRSPPPPSRRRNP
jgi:hypothetical protein